MPKLSFAQRLVGLQSDFADLIASSSGEELAVVLRTMDAAITAQIRLHNLATGVPVREPLAVTLGLIPVQAPGAAYCIACGKHHAQPSECPYDTCRS